MSLRAFVALGGGIAAAVGLVLLSLIGVSATGDDTNPYSGITKTASWDCGTVFSPDRPVEPLRWEPDQEKACSSALSTRQVWGWSLAGVGALVLLGAAVVRMPSRRAGGATAEADQPNAG